MLPPPRPARGPPLIRALPGNGAASRAGPQPYLPSVGIPQPAPSLEPHTVHCGPSPDPAALELAEGRTPQLLGGSSVGRAWIPFLQASWDEARPELGAGVSEVMGNNRAPFRTTWSATGMVFSHRTHGWGCRRAGELPGCRWGPGCGGGAEDVRQEGPGTARRHCPRPSRPSLWTLARHFARWPRAVNHCTSFRWFSSKRPVLFRAAWG